MAPTVILVRHAQGYHNVENKCPPFPVFSSPDYSLHDPELTELGRDQCRQVRDKLVPRIPKDFDVGLIIVSPMKRTIQTALLMFGELIERGVPIMAHAGWQENGVQPCDIGSSIDELKAMFPQVDFSQVDPVFPDKSSPEAAFYHETKSAIINRGQTVLIELRERPEKAVIVVSHSGFLRLGCTGHWFMNADWRVFEFEEGEEVKLRQWEETKAGGMGWSWEETVPLGHGLPEP